MKRGGSQIVMMSLSSSFLLLWGACICIKESSFLIEAFQQQHHPAPSFLTQQSRRRAVRRSQRGEETLLVPSKWLWEERTGRSSSSKLYAFYNDFEENDKEEEDDDEEEDDEYLNVDSLGDWRDFRRNLALVGGEQQQQRRGSSVIGENEALLMTQCEDLAREFGKGVWAHTAPAPEVGGLVVRMPLESEIYRNSNYSLIGRKLHLKHKLNGLEAPDVWYRHAQRLVENGMLKLAHKAGRNDGQIEASALDDEAAELLQLYLDNQETWQEVCLVLEHNNNAQKSKTATALVLNRPMSLKLTENLAHIVLYGADYDASDDVSGITTAASRQQKPGRSTSKRPKPGIGLAQFMRAFRHECAVYIGGPDEQDEPAEILHGIADLPGAVEISPGTRIYCGGLEAAVKGVLQGKYKPMDFRFFVGRHSFDESELERLVLLGKYQPIACARSLVLKQCISLPKPLWHEVLELCGGEMKEISELEFSKTDNFRFQIIDEDDDGFDEEDEVIDELSELDRFDDDEDEDFY